MPDKIDSLIKKREKRNPDLKKARKELWQDEYNLRMSQWLWGIKAVIDDFLADLATLKTPESEVEINEECKRLWHCFWATRDGISYCERCWISNI